MLHTEMVNEQIKHAVFIFISLTITAARTKKNNLYLDWLIEQNVVKTKKPHINCRRRWNERSHILEMLPFLDFAIYTLHI